MANKSLWSDKKSIARKKESSDYEGGAEKLLQFAETHSSPRQLERLKLRAELRKWDMEQRPPTVAEIQQRYNLTEQYADKFIKKLVKERTQASKKPTPRNLKPADVALGAEPHAASEQERKVEAEADRQRNDPAQLSVILEDIRSRYGDEIRQKGEQTAVQEGFIYLVTNPWFQGWVKAGMTIDYELRLGAYNTSDPLTSFDYVRLAWTPNRRAAESELLTALGQAADERRGEWFRMPLPKSVCIFDACRPSP